MYNKPNIKEIVMYSSLLLLIGLWFVNLAVAITTGESDPIIKEMMIFLSILCLGMLILLLRDMDRI